MAAAQCVQMNAFQLQQLQQVQQQQAQQANSQQQPLSVNSSSQHSSRPIIERGASWSYNETRILLSLWGQDMVQRQLTNSKRTRHVWEKIAERIREHGFERTAGKLTLLSSSVSAADARVHVLFDKMANLFLCPFLLVTPQTKYGHVSST